MNLLGPLALSSILAFSAAPLRASDPPAPPGGFGFVLTANNLVAWADGYQTLMDVYEPAAVAPATGWPVLLILHGGGESKNVSTVVGVAQFLASMGYVCVAYDSRTDGSTPALNPAWPPGLTHEELLHDSAESFGKAAALPGFAGKLDLARLGVLGFSQGGFGSANAAAWSGKPIPCPAAGCAITTYPTILAAAPKGHSLDWLEKNMPGGILVNDETVDDMGPTNPFLVLLDADDYPGALGWLRAQFSATTYPELQTSTVPLFVTMAWDDQKLHPNPSIDGFNALPAGTPRRFFLSTGGHTSATNLHENRVLADLRRRWFDRFLKGLANGADLETTWETAVQPDAAVALNPASIWEHRSAAAWPPTIAPTTFHLRGGGNLTAAPPPAVEAGPVLNHVVAPGWIPSAYVTASASTNLAVAFANMPFVSAVFETAPFTETTELFGRAHVVLHANDTTGVFQLSAALAHVSPGGAVEQLTMGTGGIRSGAAGAQLLEFDLIDQARIIPAGHRLRLTLMNLARHQTPTYQKIRFLPYFTNTTTSVQIAPATPSRIELPLRPYVPNVAPRFAEQSESASIAHTMRVSGTAARAGWIYALLLGTSGEAPATVFPGIDPIPLVFDSVTIDGANAANGPYLPNFVGVLGASGFAFPAMTVPAGTFPQLVGLRVTFAGVLLDPAGPVLALGPTTLEILP